MEIIDQIVDFEKYCKTCKHKNLKPFISPCNECLDECVNTNSEKPMNYEANPKLVKEEKNKEGVTNGNK